MTAWQWLEQPLCSIQKTCWQFWVHVPTASVNGSMPFQGYHTGLFYSTVQMLCAGLCSLITLALLDGPFSFSSLSSVSPRLLRSSALTLRSRWDTCQKATQPHRANNWARHTQFTAGEKHTWKQVINSRKQKLMGQDSLCQYDGDTMRLTLFTLLIGFLRPILHLASILVDFTSFCNLIK